MKKRLLKKYENAEKLMGKRLSGRYAQTVARRINAFGHYDFWLCRKIKTNKKRKFIILPCTEIVVGFDGREIERENGFFYLLQISEYKPGRNKM